MLGMVLERPHPNRTEVAVIDVLLLLDHIKKFHATT
jgi:hypothetical protein